MPPAGAAEHRWPQAGWVQGLGFWVQGLGFRMWSRHRVLAGVEHTQAACTGA